MNKEYLILPPKGLFVREVMYKTVDIFQTTLLRNRNNALEELSEMVEIGEDIDFIVDEKDKIIYKKCTIVNKGWRSKYTNETKKRIRFTYGMCLKKPSDWESYIRDSKLSEIRI